MITIPQQLQGCRFVLIRRGEKRPFEKGWPTKAQYKYGDPVLMKHLEAGENYGIPGSNNFFSIDADTLELQKIIEERLPRTFARNSPGHPGGGANFFRGSISKKKIRLRVVREDGTLNYVGEIQGRGGQVVGPGSIHPNGNPYTVLHDLPLAYVTEEAVGEVLGGFIEPDPKMDERLKAWSAEKLSKYQITVEIPITKIYPIDNMKRVGNEFVGSHPVHGSTKGDNFHINPVKNVWHCFRCNSGGDSVSLLAVLEGIVDCSAVKKGSKSLRGRKFKEVLMLLKDRGFDIHLESPYFKYFDDTNNFVPKRLADDISEKYRFVTHRQSHVIYVHTNGVYEPMGEEVIKGECRKRLEEQVRGWHVSEVVRHIAETTYTGPERFTSPANLINTESGPLDLETLKIVPAPDDVLFLNKIPVKYDPTASCPKILKFLSEIVNPEDIPLIQEVAGYCLYRKYFLHRAVMLLGSGANGKSTLLNLIRSLVGHNNSKSISLQELIYDRFATADLFGALVNIYADIPTTKLTRTGTFKMLVGEDMIRGQRKHRDPFDFWNYAKQLFSANELPPTDDLSEAWWRRWILIKFPNSFPEDGPNTDPHLLEKLTMPEERSGFLNWAIVGLKRLLENGKFTMTKTRREIEEMWVAQSDSLRAFALKFADYNAETAVIKEDFMAAYFSFCKDEELPAVDASVVGRRLPTIVPRVFSERPKLGERQRPAWIGLMLIEPYFKGRVWVKVPQHTLSEHIKDNKGVASYLWRTAKNYDNIVHNIEHTIYKGSNSRKDRDNLTNLTRPPEPSNGPTAQDIGRAVCEYRKTTLAKLKLAELIGVPLDRLKTVLEELEKKRAVRDMGSMVEVL